jgi:polyisoprenoid-binding protein YceI
MKKLLTSIMLLTMVSAFAKAEKWVIDNAHTKIGFEVPHLIISSVDGKFKTFSGDLTFDLKKPKDSVKDFSFDVSIDTNSIDTGNTKRDKHLMSADFFNVKKKGNDKITFKSTKVKTHDGKKFKVTGKFTVNGKTKEITVYFKYLGSADVYDVKRIAFTGKATIKREDFNLGWNDGEVTASNAVGKLAEAAGTIGSDVVISIKLQAKRKSDL